jgi:hypothetical protein
MAIDRTPKYRKNRQWRYRGHMGAEVGAELAVSALLYELVKRGILDADTALEIAKGHTDSPGGAHRPKADPRP